MLSDVVEQLRCPHCERQLTLAGRTLTCPNGHAFDVARQGYVSLLPGDARAGTADTPEMVAARERFLTGGHLAPVAEALASECERLVPEAPGAVVDVGAGTGYYLAAVLDALPGRAGIALDISKHAARRAARAPPRVGAVVCDAWRSLPVRTGAAAAVLSVFSPRNGAEMRRIVRPNGALLLVTPTPEHLAEVAAGVGLLSVDERKEERLEERLGGFFQLESRTPCSVPLSLGRPEVEQLVGMGPSARHTDPATTRKRVATLRTPIAATASVTVSAYRPR
jgi:23S rRNA (guanine745-N1)-methyltransferase